MPGESENTTYAALLCAVNVGGRRRVPMAQLRDVLGGRLGWGGVRTHLQSGNAVFTTADRDPRGRLEQALEAEFGFEVPCVLRTADELAAEVAACPFPAAQLDPAKLAVLFLQEEPQHGRFDAIDREAYAPDEFRHIGRAVYCYYPGGMGRSKLPAALARVRPALTATARNWRTVLALLEFTGRTPPG